MDSDNEELLLFFWLISFLILLFEKYRLMRLEDDSYQ